jgi:hypothetical protein
MSKDLGFDGAVGKGDAGAVGRSKGQTASVRPPMEATEPQNATLFQNVNRL